MRATAALVVVLAVIGLPVEATGQEPIRWALPGDSMRGVWEAGTSYPDFLRGVQRRQELWQRLSGEGDLPADLASRAGAAADGMRILVVAEDWCGDSAYNLPYVARLAASAGVLELRIVDSQAGAPLLARYRTPDGRAATPLFLLLDAAWDEVGCLVERPTPLMDWYQANRDSMARDDLYRHMLEWYETDGGRTVSTDIVDLLEAAARGEGRCAARGG